MLLVLQWLRFCLRRLADVGVCLRVMGVTEPETNILNDIQLICLGRLVDAVSLHI